MKSNNPHKWQHIENIFLAFFLTVVLVAVSQCTWRSCESEHQLKEAQIKNEHG